MPSFFLFDSFQRLGQNSKQNFICFFGSNENKRIGFRNLLNFTGYLFLSCMIFFTLISIKDCCRSPDICWQLREYPFRTFSNFRDFWYPPPPCLQSTKKLQSLQGDGAIRPCGWLVCRCTAGPLWAAWTWPLWKLYFKILFCFIPMKSSQSFLASKDGSKFWWLHWFSLS